MGDTTLDSYFRNGSPADLTDRGKRAVVASLVYDKLGLIVESRGTWIGDFINNIDRLMRRHRVAEERLAKQILGAGEHDAKKG